MPEALGSATIDVGANLAPLDADLKAAELRLQRFSASNSGDKSLDGLRNASKSAQAAIKMLDSQLGSMQRSAVTAGTGYSAAAGAMAVANQRLAVLDERLAQAENELNVAREKGINLLQAQNDNARLASGGMENLNKTTESGGGGWKITNEGIETFGKVAKYGAGAAYIFSSTFRGAANSIVKDGLSIAAALAPGIFSGFKTATTILAPAISFVSRVAWPIAAVVTGFKVINSLLEEGSRKVTELSANFDKIKKTDFDIEFFNRGVAGAKAMKESTDDAAASFQKFSDAARSKSQGGSGSLNDALDNSGISGTDAIKNATTVEEKYRATAKVIQEALDRGERLGALDLASKFWSPEIVQRLAVSSDYLVRMQQAADAASRDKFVDQQDVALAAQLKDRYDAALVSLNEALFDFTTMGLNVRGVWVSVVEMTAAVTAGIGNWIAKLGDARSTLEGMLREFGSSDFWRWLSDKMPKINIGQYKIAPEGTPDGQQLTNARNSLALQMNSLSIRKAQAAALEVEAKVWGDATKAVKTYDDTVDALKKMAPGAFREEDLTSRLEEAKKKYDEARKALFQAAGPSPVDTKKLEELKDIYDEVTEAIKSAGSAWDKELERINRTTAAMMSQGASIGKTSEFQEQLRVELQLLNAAKRDGVEIDNDAIDKYSQLRTSMSQTEALTASGITMDKARVDSMKELAEQAAAAKANFERLNFELQNQRALDSNKISEKSLTAFSPAAKGEIAAMQKRLELQEALTKGHAKEAQVVKQVEGARRLAVMGELVQLSEARRQRALSADLAAESMRVETANIGKTAAEQYRLSAIEQARQTLVQEAAAKRIPFDKKELDALTEKINKTAQLRDLQVRAAVNDNIKFGQQTSLLDPADVQIASQLRDIYPDVTEALASAEAQAMRLNTAMSQTAQTMSNGLATAFTDIAMGNKTFGESFRSMGLIVVRALREMIIKMMIIQPLMRSIQSGFGGGLFGGLFGGGGAASAPTDVFGAAGAGFAVPTFAKDGATFSGPGISALSGQILTKPTMFAFAKGAAIAGEDGDEGVFPLTRINGKLGVRATGAGGAMAVHIGGPTIIVEGDASENTVNLIDQKLREYNAGLPDKVVAAVQNAKSRRTPGL